MRKIILFISLLAFNSLMATDYYTVSSRSPELESVNILESDIYIVGEWHTALFTNKVEIQLFDQIIKKNPKVNCLFLEIGPEYTNKVKRITPEDLDELELARSYVQLFGELSLWAQKNNLNIISNDFTKSNYFYEVSRNKTPYLGEGDRDSYIANIVKYERNNYFVENINQHHTQECLASIFLTGASHITETGTIEYLGNNYEPINHALLSNHGISSQSFIISPYKGISPTSLGLQRDALKIGTRDQSFSFDSIETMIFNI